MPEELLDFMIDCARQLPFLDAQQAGAELYGSPRFTPFELFSPNEITLSRIVSDLFDPKGLHGQGTLFVNALFDSLQLQKLNPHDHFRINREVSIANGRRIDLLIETKFALIGIENKPWASQQKNQLADYFCYIKSKSRNLSPILIFFSDQKPQTAKNDVLCVSYQKKQNSISLQEIFANLLPQIKSQKIRYFIEDFVTYIDKQFGENQMLDRNSEPYLEIIMSKFAGNAEYRRVIASVIISQKILYDSILDDLGDSFAKFVHRKFSDVQTIGRLSERLKIKDQSWLIRRQGWPANCSVAIESSYNNAGKIIFGVIALSPEYETTHPGQSCAVRVELEQLKSILGDGKNSHWWPWYQEHPSGSWSPQFIFGLVLESPSGLATEHPLMEEMARKILYLFEAVETTLAIDSNM